jgi:hypothetical protein
MKFKRVISGLTETGIYRHALFLHFPGGLRFALSEGDGPLDQVLSALRKATAICEDALGSEASFLLHMQEFVYATRFELRNTIRELRLAGLEVPKDRDVWVEAVGDGSDFGEGYWINCAFDVPTSKLQNLLWCAVVTDFGLFRPSPQCLIYLINPVSGVLIHPYDDRGMDVLCRNPVPLKSLYDRHNSWLLDYNREAMDETFSNE